MRVMHVIEAMHQGGAESLVVEHVRLAGEGVESSVVALNRGGPSFEAACRAGARGFDLGKGGARLGALWRLTRLMREHRIEVVNGHNPTGALYGTLAARLAGVPVVVRTEHSIHYAGRGFRAYGPVEALITALSDRVICVCEASRQSHAPRFGWAADRFVTILNGISEAAAPEDRAAARRALGIPEQARMALTVGSLTPQKSQDRLLRAFAGEARAIPGSLLCIVGEGRLESELRALQASLGLADRVRFVGAREDIPRWMAACDLFVLSSSREGLSITLLEAMRAARACVATDVGGNPEAVADGESGRIVPAGDVRALGAAIASLLADPERCDRLGLAGAARFSGHFTASRMVRETEALYRQALRRRRGEAA